MSEDNLKRTVEVFTGAYASGKSESALNRALQYAKRGKDITLVDLDTVEPAYCLRPIIEELKEKGISIIAQTDYFGLGEAGSYVTAEQINCLSKNGDMIIDVGYGASGLDILDILNNIEQEKDLRIYLVVNTSKSFVEKFRTYPLLLNSIRNVPSSCFVISAIAIHASRLFSPYFYFASIRQHKRLLISYTQCFYNPHHFFKRHSATLQLLIKVLRCLPNAPTKFRKTDILFLTQLSYHVRCCHDPPPLMYFPL